MRYFELCWLATAQLDIFQLGRKNRLYTRLDVQLDVYYWLRGNTVKTRRLWRRPFDLRSLHQSSHTRLRGVSRNACARQSPARHRRRARVDGEARRVAFAGESHAHVDRRRGRVVRALRRHRATQTGRTRRCDARIRADSLFTSLVLTTTLRALSLIHI